MATVEVESATSALPVEATEVQQELPAVTKEIEVEAAATEEATPEEPSITEEPVVQETETSKEEESKEVEDVQEAAKTAKEEESTEAVDVQEPESFKDKESAKVVEVQEAETTKEEESKKVVEEAAEPTAEEAQDQNEGQAEDVTKEMKVEEPLETNVTTVEEPAVAAVEEIKEAVVEEKVESEEANKGEVGMVISTLSMFLAAMVEKMRRDSALSNHGVSPISVLWLIPQIGVIGIGESFSAIGQVEFYNRQFPENMKTLAGSLFCLSQAGANYVTSLMVTIIQKTTGGDGRKNWLDDDINEGRLDYYYYLIATLGVMNLIYFLLCAKSYRYKGM